MTRHNTYIRALTLLFDSMRAKYFLFIFDGKVCSILLSCLTTPTRAERRSRVSCVCFMHTPFSDAFLLLSLFLVKSYYKRLGLYADPW
jgi:hypothetical protein